MHGYLSERRLRGGDVNVCSSHTFLFFTEAEVADEHRCLSGTEVSLRPTAARICMHPPCIREREACTRAIDGVDLSNMANPA
jgi:hypothetical protein